MPTGVNRQRLRLAVVLVMALLIAGCAPGGSSESPAGQAAFGYATTSQERASSIPGLEFVDPSSTTGTPGPIEGARLEPGSYRSFLTGDHVVSTQWAAVLDTNDSILLLRLDEEGTRVFADWTESHLGDSVPVALYGRILIAPTIREPITDGGISIPMRTDTDMRQELEAAIVPAP